jgi:hypothetical protein
MEVCSYAHLRPEFTALPGSWHGWHALFCANHANHANRANLLGGVYIARAQLFGERKAGCHRPQILRRGRAASDPMRLAL